ncbi:MAG TPA: hypothetical protein VES20_23655, partial [Bryobacteraceae bacterium]|nr:hypothetical protein [Bryobacteraceae bacterium]
RLDETFEHWDRKALVDEVVSILRDEEPHMIIARFHGAERDGHGNHQAAGVIAKEAFQRLTAVSKLFVSTRPGEASTHSVRTGDYDPLVGMTWRDLGTLGYRQHRTQGMGGIPGLRGGPDSTLRLIESRVPDNPNDLRSGITAPGSAGNALEMFDARQPWRSVPALVQALRSASTKRQRALLEEAIARALCLRLDAFVAGSQPVPGQRFTAKVSLAYEGRAEGTTRLVAPDGWPVDGLNVTVPADAKPGPASVFVEASLRVEGTEVRVRRPVEYQTVHPVDGPQRSALEVLPVLSLSVWPEVALRPAGVSQHSVHVTARANAPCSGEVRLAGQSVPLRFLAAGEVFTREFTTGSQLVNIEAACGTSRAEVQQKVVISDVQIPSGLRIGYVQGAGDQTAAMLRHAGVQVHDLTAEDLATGDLSRYQAILVGVRASAVRPEWKAHRTRLLDYAERGGNIVIQYQTEEFDDAPFGPFPYKLTARSEEVSEEKAPVQILKADHRIFHRPNVVDADAFAGWIEQRGSKWMTEWDPRYEALLESHDRGQAPQKGGLLVARTGKGHWSYAAYAFYRQLPAGVPGAWKLLVNLLSLGVV